MRHDVHPIDRSSLFTNGVPVSNIEGLINAETIDFTKPEEQAKFSNKEVYRSEEIFGQYTNLSDYINCPVEMAFDYAANVFSLEEYTASLRDFRHVGAGVYRALDKLSPDTYIYLKIEAYPESGVVDYLCAWDQGHELWMRYHFRFLDAMKTIKKPGTIVLWNNCRHPYYDRSEDAPEYVAGPRARKDRLWVGDFWNSFYTGHLIETQNMKKILEARFTAG